MPVCRHWRRVGRWLCPLLDVRYGRYFRTDGRSVSGPVGTWIGQSLMRSSVGNHGARLVLSVGQLVIAFYVSESALRPALLVDSSCRPSIKLRYSRYHRTVGRSVGWSVVALSGGKRSVGSVLWVGRCYIRRRKCRLVSIVAVSYTHLTLPTTPYV